MIKYFENIGYTIEKIPEDLLKKLKKECEVAKNERYFKSKNIDEMISGLSSRGVPKHFFLKTTAKELNNFVLKFFAETYNKKFNLLGDFKLLTNDVPVVAYDPWVNIQEKCEFIPNHRHDGIASYVIWIKIPYQLSDECVNSTDTTSCFQFTYLSAEGTIRTHTIHVDQSYEGYMIMFPAKLQHCVYPFYSSNDVRISISGNISFST